MTNKVVCEECGTDKDVSLHFGGNFCYTCIKDFFSPPDEEDAFELKSEVAEIKAVKGTQYLNNFILPDFKDYKVDVESLTDDDRRLIFDTLLSQIILTEGYSLNLSAIKHLLKEVK